MNRSSRQSKSAKLDESLLNEFAEVAADRHKTPNASSAAAGLSPILPKSSSVASTDFFPEFDAVRGVSGGGLNTTNSETVAVPFPLPEALPPLQLNLSKSAYNTRKRTSSEAVVSEDLMMNSNGRHSSLSRSSSGDKSPTIPGFVSKLYRMVDESTSNLIKWGGDGKTFVVTSPEEFSRQVLPLFFKHNNFSSFVRQLNMYGFHKVPHLQQGSMAASALGSSELTVWEFSHHNFIRNRPDLLINVRRKIGKEEDSSSPGLAPSSLNSDGKVIISDDFMATASNLRQELLYIQQQQNALRTDLQSLQRDNQLLWSENLASRERHLQQQQVIDRILRFLASVFTTDGKLLASASLSGINASTLSALQSNLSMNPSPALSATSLSGNHRTTHRQPLLLGNISGVETDEDIRRQVMELISGTSDDPNTKKDKINLVREVSSPLNAANQPNDFINLSNFDRIEDLENTTKDISKDISLVEDEISSVLNTSSATAAAATSKERVDSAASFDDLDFSSYLNCQSLE